MMKEDMQGRENHFTIYNDWLTLGLCSPLAMLDGSRFSCHATIIEHDMKLMSIAKK